MKKDTKQTPAMARQLSEILKENAEYKTENDRLIGRLEELEDMPDVTPLVAVLERFADHRNYTPEGKYAPIIKELYDHPADVAAAALRANQ